MPQIHRGGLHLLKEGPFDGVLGFSQGGALAGILAALQHDAGQREAGVATDAAAGADEARMVEELVPDVRFKFVVIISGFYCRDVRPAFATRLLAPKSDAAAVDVARVDKIALPSFHVWGEADTLGGGG